MIHSTASEINSLKSENERLQRELESLRERLEHAKAIERLQASEAQFRMVVNTVQAFVSYVDTDTRYRFVNATYTQWFGLPPAAVIGRTMREVLGEESYARAAPRIHSALSGQSVKYESMLKKADGKTRWIEAEYTPHRDAEGKVLGFVIVGHDITDRKTAEQHMLQAIQERDRSLETLATINQVGQRLTAELEMEKIVQDVTDAATRLSRAQFGAFFYNVKNEAGEAYTLYSISGVPREKFSHFPLPRNTAVFHPTFVGAGTVRSDDILKDPRYGKNAPHSGMPEGHLPVRSYLAVSVISRTGEVLGGLFFGHEKTAVFTEQAEDIVEGLASQAAVAIDNARLYGKIQDSVRARDEFLSIASHELKTPLTTLKLQAQMRQKTLNKGQASYFTAERLDAMIDGDIRQISRLSRLIDDMLDISRINTGKLSITPERFDLCELAKEVLDRHRPQLEASGSDATLSCGIEVSGEWDRFRIEQVLANLLNNAARYGSGKPVEVRVDHLGDKARIQVIDQGIGIAKENQERIFHRFERAVSANEISGLGLGLYIVREIVNMHGGAISVVSEPGQGSTFTVELPI